MRLKFINNRGVAQLGRALRSGRRGRRFNSCHPDQNSTIKMIKKNVSDTMVSIFLWRAVYAQENI